MLIFFFQLTNVIFKTSREVYLPYTLCLLYSRHSKFPSAIISLLERREIFLAAFFLEFFLEKNFP